MDKFTKDGGSAFSGVLVGLKFLYRPDTGLDEEPSVTPLALFPIAEVILSSMAELMRVYVC